MERLTEKPDDNYITRQDLRNNGHKKCMNKLGELEDLEEQGRLLILPCKISDYIYVIPSEANYHLNILHKHKENNRVYKQQVESVAMYDNESYLLWTCDGTHCVLSESYGENWFLTHEDAEKALEVINSENA